MKKTNGACNCLYTSSCKKFQPLSHFPVFSHYRSIIGSTGEHTSSHRHTPENQSWVKLHQNRIFSSDLYSPTWKNWKQRSLCHCATRLWTELGGTAPGMSPAACTTPTSPHLLSLFLCLPYSYNLCCSFLLGPCPKPTLSRLPLW